MSVVMEDVIEAGEIGPYFGKLCDFRCEKKEQEEQVHRKILYILCLSNSMLCDRKIESDSFDWLQLS